MVRSRGTLCTTPSSSRCRLYTLQGKGSFHMRFSSASEEMSFLMSEPTALPLLDTNL